MKGVPVFPGQDQNKGTPPLVRTRTRVPFPPVRTTTGNSLQPAQHAIHRIQRGWYASCVFTWGDFLISNLIQLSITRNHRTFGCPVIPTVTNSQYYFLHYHLNNAWYKRGHWLTVGPYLSMIASNVANNNLEC